MRFLIINGPNINMLGIREPSVYGRSTYADLVKLVDNFCADESVECEFFQSNHEGCIVDKIQDAYGKFDGIVINPAAYTHTSIAILDALKAVAIPTVEVHISNVSERESFRQISFVSFYALKTYQGLGFDGYIEAVKFLKEYILLDKTQ